jgi:hypothetical protein
MFCGQMRFYKIRSEQALMLAFFLMITLPFALAAWAWAGIFLYLAVIGRPYGDFVSALQYHGNRTKLMINQILYIDLL